MVRARGDETLSDDLLGVFLDELADRVAARLAENGSRPSGEKQAAGPWRLWTLSTTAERLTRSETWVRKQAKAGELASIRLDGGALAFDPEDVRAFAEARRIGGAELDERPAEERAEWWK